MTRLVALLLLLTGLLPAQVLDEAWEAGRYEDILLAIDEALARGVGDEAALLHDRGACLYRLGRYPEAVLAYRRSLLRAPGEAETVFDLGLAERRLGIVRTGPAGFAGRVLVLVDSLSDRGGLLLLLGLELTSIVSIVLFRRRRRPLALALLLFLIFLIAADRYRRLRLDPTPLEAVVLQPGSLLRAAPHEKLPGLVELQPGSLVVVARRGERFALVSQDGRSGWVEAGRIGLVD